ncbi:MAG: hypothetical protein QM730_18400 [Anaerolineales bacterium]
MINEVCRLDGAGIICFESKKDSSSWKQPKPVLYTNIPMLWKILESVIQDWERAAEPFQNSIDSSKTENEKIYHVGRALLELPIYYFKCLFSYVTFFVALENAYDLFYEELNAINRMKVFRVQHHKKPQRNSYIEKVRAVRNISIAHIGSKEVSRIDAKAGMMWEPLMLTKKIDEAWDLSKLSFGSGKWKSRDLTGNTIEEQSIDLEIGGISEMRSECMNFIDRYDEVCAEYLNALAEKLPVEEGDTFYSFVK